MRRLLLPFLFLFLVVSSFAQTPATAAVPPLVKFSGTLANPQGTVGVIFALYADQTGGAPLWLETQNVTPDANGRYTVNLGATHANGVPLDVFASAEARWLGVQPEGQAEQSRVQLVSVPYALKAADATTLGGQPLSAFVLASAAGSATTGTGGSAATAGSVGVLALASPQAGGGVTTSGSAATNYLAKFSTATNVEPSLIYDSGTAVGIGTTAPLALLHVVSGTALVGMMDAYSGSPSTNLGALPMVSRAARGTAASPSGVKANDYIGGLGARAYGTTKFTNGWRAAVLLRADQDWTDTAQGTNIAFGVTARDTAAQMTAMTLTSGGSLGIGTTTPDSLLTVAGPIHSTTGGFKFPDGSTQASAAANVASGSGLTTNIASGVATLGVDTSVLQSRVSGSCPNGAISQINQNGTVTCIGTGGSSGGIQTGYLTASLSTALNAAPAVWDSYRVPLDQGITVTGISVTASATGIDTRCVPPLLSLTDGALGRDIVLQNYTSELDADSELLTFAPGTVLRLGAQQGLYCPGSLSPTPPSYKVVVRFRPAVSGDVSLCDPGLTNCNGYCADTSTSVQNCGACGNSCPSTATSIAVCTSGTCSQICTSGASMCGGSCVDTKTDPNNCGGCLNNGGWSCYAPSSVCSAGSCTTCPSGVACNGSCCASGQVCGTTSSGKFSPLVTSCMSSCPSGTTNCNGQCVDTDWDANNCGACNSICSYGFAGTVCSSGKCVCPSGSQPSCAWVPYPFSPPINVCVSSTNPNACGTCGNTCTSTQTCSAGTCVTCPSGLVCNGACCGTGQVCVGNSCVAPSSVCAMGQSYCSGFCTDPSTDAYNCGACGHRCSYGQVCYNSHCQAPPSGLLFCANTWVNVDNNNCGACGRKCGAGATCVAGDCQCTNSSQTLCGNTCTNLADNNNCGACGTVCGAGQYCHASGSGPASCATCSSPNTICNGACATLQSDNNNCGACGWTCLSGQFCSAGKCIYSCPSGQTKCGNSCVSTQTDNNNCGACGSACTAPGSTCVAGVCQGCATGLTACNSYGSWACLNTLTDNQNCGGCGYVCAGGQACVNGVCPQQCSAGQTYCGGACVNTQSDSSNCGACGNQCKSNQACQAGACATTSCSYDKIVCGNSCVNPQTDRNNCGACGLQCSPSQTCTGGKCIACASPNTLCGGNTCTNLKTDNKNCGSCNMSCMASNPVCSAGTCCPTGQISCNGSTCFDPSSDNNNCGACGNACGTQCDSFTCGGSAPCQACKVCQAGTCSCPSGATVCNGKCTYLSSDDNNCGKCGTKCDYVHGYLCQSGACTAFCSGPAC